MPPPLCHRRRDRRRGRGPQGRGRVTPPSAGLHAANVAGVVAMRKRARQTVAELSLPPCPAAIGSPAVAHGVTPVSFCRRKMPLLRRRRILPKFGQPPSLESYWRSCCRAAAKPVQRPSLYRFSRSFFVR
ncbi:uncharacterized protein LOC110268894 isoform X2 [Arachis ipaensis]|uniref:uncharacterized protein LOC110268894 isoform X2 n=1 Tax=Arachis ipaensis TaxID=130454 RepID=UPI000A2AF740|nr:uncharacterized protein LOC110268894 isoform X2 [Arachis ipaensis]